MHSVSMHGRVLAERCAERVRRRAEQPSAVPCPSPASPAHSHPGTDLPRNTLLRRGARISSLVCSTVVTWIFLALAQSCISWWNGRDSLAFGCRTSQRIRPELLEQHGSSGHAVRDARLNADASFYYCQCVQSEDNSTVACTPRAANTSRVSPPLKLGGTTAAGSARSVV